MSTEQKKQDALIILAEYHQATSIPVRCFCVFLCIALAAMNIVYGRNIGNPLRFQCRVCLGAFMDMEGFFNHVSAELCRTNYGHVFGTTPTVNGQQPFYDAGIEALVAPPCVFPSPIIALVAMVTARPLTLPRTALDVAKQRYCQLVAGILAPPSPPRPPRRPRLSEIQHASQWVLSLPPLLRSHN